MIDATAFLNDLNEFINEQEKQMLGIDETNEYLVNDKNQANYFIKLSKEKADEMEEVKALVAGERTRLMHLLDEYEKQQLESLQRQKDFYDNALECFVRRELEGGKKRSLKLPNGSIGLKKQQPQYDYDEEILLQWAEEHAPDMIKQVVKTTINKTSIKKLGEINDGELWLNGEPIPGITITARDDKFEVK